MKKLLGIVLSAAMLLSMAACGSTAASSAAADSTADAATATDAAASDLKVGVITIGDETEGYTAAHINGIKAAAQKLGMSDSQIVWKYKVPEGAECSDAAEDLVGQGCNLVVSNSYGHQTYIVEEAEKYPDVTFEVEYADEDVGNNVGSYSYKSGEQIHFIEMSGSQQGLGLAISLLGLETYFEFVDGQYRAKKSNC